MANKKKEEEVLGTVQPAVQSNYSAEGLNSCSAPQAAKRAGECQLSAGSDSERCGGSAEGMAG